MLEFEDPREVPASHLVKARCRECGADALTVPERAREARCGPCLSAKHGTGGDVELGSYGPVVARFVGPVDVDVAAKAMMQDLVVVAQEVTSRDVRPAGYWEPGPVTSLAEAARLWGWEVRVQYARGLYGKTVQDSWALRFGRHHLTDDAAYAMRVGDTWKSVWVWGPKLSPYGKMGIEDLKTWLKREPVQLESVTARRDAQILAAKIVACPGPPECERLRSEHTHRANGDVKAKRARKDVEHGN